MLSASLKAKIDICAQKIRTLNQFPLVFFYHQASTHMIAAEGGCIVTKILKVMKFVCFSFVFLFYLVPNYGTPATPGIETRIAHFNTRCCVYISISYNALASGKRQKARALYNCSLLWSYQDSFYKQQGKTYFLSCKV